MRSSQGLLLCVLSLTWVLPVRAERGGGGEEGWDISVDQSVNYTGARFCNPCANPPQVLEITEGSQTISGNLRKLVNDDGALTAWELRLHVTHQGTKATGYDLVVNEMGELLDSDGNVVSRCGEAALAKDADGESITTEYSIPGHYQYIRSIAMDGNVADVTEVFACHLISHGKGGNNAIVHYRGRIAITDHGDLTFELDTDRLWCKCAGPADDGVVSCQDSPEGCVDAVLY